MGAAMTANRSISWSPNVEVSFQTESSSFKTMLSPQGGLYAPETGRPSLWTSETPGLHISFGTLGQLALNDRLTARKFSNFGCGQHNQRNSSWSVKMSEQRSRMCIGLICIFKPRGLLLTALSRRSPPPPHSQCGQKDLGNCRFQ
jgi:hypothetical protein